ncbi:hypothetical protein A2755_02490 [Candidatus Wolfebacteria bacterium RIFCSPHIGHO2_01_FULL_48_22]|uniref:Prepilin type IV endopeptidase peptidase domain-containing protein n=2 Tax=Candidatus Wolfeibacteriota TaxID=1752735 RepID=A0A1F8DRI0_9BACT|nr:MAG: hypothetical protein A2755_02490 [Candidatus Wolfebacteria bacterium RIFCSPHIGHO2_01_FULL_48_22]OGM92254.1 MAG: hypothetical protein A2935_00580 [Candidatus Wolfebacteria bacterium RIFCSPLOWO2_01_FULL_47_17b]
MFHDWILIFSIVLFATNFASQRFNFPRRRLDLFWLNAIFVFLFLSVLTYLQYSGWANSPLTAYLLPPKTSVSYFIQYVFFRIWSSHIMSFGFALLAVYGLRIYNKKKEGALLREHEEWIAGSAILLSGFPGVVLFVPVFFMLFLLTTAVQTLRKGKEYRVSPYYMWFPTALCVILTVYLFFSQSSWWLLLRP